MKLFPIMQEALRKRKVFIYALFTRPESLAALLPYQEFIEEENIFQLKDGSLGAIFEVGLLEHEPMREKDIIRAMNTLKPWFSLPENCTLQILYNQSHLSKFDESIKKIEESFPNAHSVSKLIFDEKIQTLKDSCGKNSELSPLQRKTFLSVRYFPSTKWKKATLNHELQGFIAELKDFKRVLKSFKTGSDIALRPLNANELLDFLRKFFNPKTYYKRTFAPFNKWQSLSNQFLYNSPVLDFPGMEREGVKTRTLTLKTAPLYAYPGGMAYFVGLKFPFKLSLNFSFPSKEKVKRFLDIKEFFLQHAPTARGKVQHEEVKEVQERLAREDRCLQMTFTIIVEGRTDDELDDRTQEICHVFQNKLEAEVIQEDDIGLGLAINSLPLCYTPDADYATQRSIRILRSDALHFIPIFNSFTGLKTPHSFFLSRDNNIAPFSLLDGETSNHTVILADTGSGKSAFVIESLLAAKRMNPEPLVFIIDKKSSYAMLAEYFDADMTVFERNRKVPFSPFRGVYDEEKIAFLTKLISLSIRLTSPSFPFESEHQWVITKALRLAYIKKCQRQGLTYVEGELIKKSNSEKEQVELSMEDIIVQLAQLGEGKLKDTVSSLISKLKPFYGDGVYAKFFQDSHNQSQTKTSKLFYIYDLDGLETDHTLQTLMTMAVLEEIRRILSLPENQGRTGFLVMEEFAMLGRKNPAFREFAIDFAETMRKRGCWTITLTPRPQNYFELEVGQAFWGVANNYIFLQMNPDNVDFIAENSSLIDEANKEVIRSLETKAGKYAEVFYMNKIKSRQGAFRYHQTPMAKWLSPTSAVTGQRVLFTLS